MLLNAHMYGMEELGDCHVKLNVHTQFYVVIHVSIQSTVHICDQICENALFGLCQLCQRNKKHNRPEYCGYFKLRK